jgi:hypothetical protein
MSWSALVDLMGQALRSLSLQIILQDVSDFHDAQKSIRTKSHMNLRRTIRQPKDCTVYKHPKREKPILYIPTN